MGRLPVGVAAIALGLALQACATTSSDGSGDTDGAAIRTSLQASVRSIGDAERTGAAMIGYYLDGADAARETRRNVNYGLLGLNAYTAAVLAFGWHPDNALASSSIANLLFGAANVGSPQGEGPWLTAVSQTNCILQNLSNARMYEAYVRPAEIPAELLELETAYQAHLDMIEQSYWRAYMNFRRTTAQNLTAVTLPAPQPASEGLRSTMTALADDATARAALLAGIRTERTAIGACVTGAS